MDIPDKDIDAFIAIWKKEIGTTLSRDEAKSRASRLLDLMLRLAQPLPSERAEQDAMRNHSNNSTR